MGEDGYWLERRRLAVCSRLCVALYLAALVSWLAVDVWLAETPVATLRNDFAGFWSVGHLVLDGRASDAYLPDLALAAQADHVPEHEVRLPWRSSPPTASRAAGSPASGRLTSCSGSGRCSRA